VKTRLTLILVLAFASVASAHPGHGDFVHRAIGLDWTVAAVLFAIGIATMVLAQGLLPRLAGALVACGGLVFAASLV
jgi:hypothetical protein